MSYILKSVEIYEGNETVWRAAVARAKEKKIRFGDLLILALAHYLKNEPKDPAEDLFK